MTFKTGQVHPISFVWLVYTHSGKCFAGWRWIGSSNTVKMWEVPTFYSLDRWEDFVGLTMAPANFCLVLNSYGIRGAGWFMIYIHRVYYLRQSCMWCWVVYHWPCAFHKDSKKSPRTSIQNALGNLWRMICLEDQIHLIPFNEIPQLQVALQNYRRQL